MQRLIIATFLLLSGSWATAQTVKITTPSGACTYTTGAVKSDPAVPGQLIATSTGVGTGVGCAPAGGAAVTFGPANPVTPATATLNNTGGSQSLQFQPANAVTCTASLSGGSSPTFSGGATSLQTCNSQASCALAQVIAPTFAANPSPTTDVANTVSVTCKDSSNNSAVSSATVTVSHGQTVGGCPSAPTIPSSTSGIASFTQWSGSVTANYFSSGNKVVDITSFDSVYGTWPGAVESQTAAVTLPTSKYVSLKFTVPAGYMASHSGGMGQYSLNQSAYSAPVSMTISTKCGDFSNPASDVNSSVVAGCYGPMGTTSAAFVIAWRQSGSCQLSDNTTYYLNYINADITNAKSDNSVSIPSSANSRCNASGCYDGVTNGPGTW
jgi:hypothetical protein